MTLDAWYEGWFDHLWHPDTEFHGELDRIAEAGAFWFYLHNPEKRPS